jgi:hypothetical protein
MSTMEMIRFAVRKVPLLAWLALGLLVLGGMLVLVFVGRSPSGSTVTGIINVDGEPLTKGSITFVPVDDQGNIAEGRGTGSGTIIKDGKYQIDQGLTTVGRYRVEIQGTRTIPGKKILDPVMPYRFIDAEVAVVPPEYNKKSTLIKEVVVGPNQIDFELKGIKKGR